MPSPDQPLCAGGVAQCTICLEELGEGTVSLGCGHLLHAICVLTAPPTILQTCPLCRRAIARDRIRAASAMPAFGGASFEAASPGPSMTPSRRSMRGGGDQTQDLMNTPPDPADLQQLIDHIMRHVGGAGVPSAPALPQPQLQAHNNWAFCIDISNRHKEIHSCWHCSTALNILLS